MILDRIENRERYYPLGEDIRQALEYFASVRPDAPLEKANVLLNGGRVLVKIRPMTTKPEADCPFEAHRDYLDIHFVAYGAEKIGYADLSTMRVVSYDEEKDACAVEGEGEFLTLGQGSFMITFPNDAHAPCGMTDKPGPLGKMIAKIRTGG